MNASLRLRRALATSRRAMFPGALCTDATFTRILGSAGESEPILADLIGAWILARTGSAVAAAVAVDICPRKKLPGHGLPGKGSLTVNVAVTDRESYLVEVQHRPESFFPHQALVSSASEVIAHHLSHATDLCARRVHMLAFCDYDFQGLSFKSSHRRNAPRIPARALQVFGLHASPRAMVGLDVNPALERMLAEQASFVFALLPHAPRLEELTPATPPLLRWAAVIAHVVPENIGAVPKDVRVGGVARLLEMLDATASMAQAERDDADFLAARVADWALSVRAEAEAEGIAEVLRLVGILSAADYKAKLGSAPPAEFAPFLT